MSHATVLHPFFPGTPWAVADREGYNARAKDVYWRNAPACSASGPQNASCLLPPEHGGKYHEGNGYDAYGPIHRWWIRSEA